MLLEVPEVAPEVLELLLELLWLYSPVQSTRMIRMITP